MSDVTTTILIVFLLIILNGVFAMSEMAIVSARKTRLEQQAENGSKGAKQALEMAENPNRFLSTVQVGITLIGILSGVFGGATIASEIAIGLNKIAWLAPYSQGLALAIVVILITYFSMVLGELVPKRLALANSERIAALMSPFMHFLSLVTIPIVGLLSVSTNAVLRILGVRASTGPEVTEEDIKSMLDQGTEGGVIEEAEQDMVERIFRLNDRGVTALMTPRTDVIFLDVQAKQEEIHQLLSIHPFSRFPVVEGSNDNVIGIVRARELLLQCVNGPCFEMRKVLLPVLFMPETTTALEALEKFKIENTEVAMVIDEYGGVVGLISLDDISNAIVGDVISPQGTQEAEAVQREDGSWLFDGMILVDDIKDLLNIDEFPEEKEDHYETLNGLMMSRLERVPESSDHFEWDGYKFEVVDMDGRRVDKVLVTKFTGADRNEVQI
jgi:putative hemolysin